MATDLAQSILQLAQQQHRMMQQEVAWRCGLTDRRTGRRRHDWVVHAVLLPEEQLQRQHQHPHRL